MTRPLAFALLVPFFSLFGCGEEPPPAPPPKFDFSVEVIATDSNENPLPKIPVVLDGNIVGQTDKDGKFIAILSEFAGKPVTLGVKEVEGYRFISEKTELNEELKVTTVGNEPSGVPLFLQVQAESIKKEYFVWVRANCNETLEAESCADMPVKLRGEVVATTNEHGFAHFTFDDVPQNDVEIAIETPASDPSDENASQVEPADPKYKFTLHLESQVYVIDETFSDPNGAKKKKPKSTSRRRTTKRRSATSRPSSSTPKKKKKKDEVIDLW